MRSARGVPTIVATFPEQRTVRRGEGATAAATTAAAHDRVALAARPHGDVLDAVVGEQVDRGQRRQRGGALTGPRESGGGDAGRHERDPPAPARRRHGDQPDGAARRSP
jgi:hypothetical protein